MDCPKHLLSASMTHLPTSVACSSAITPRARSTEATEQRPSAITGRRRGSYDRDGRCCSTANGNGRSAAACTVVGVLRVMLSPLTGVTADVSSCASFFTTRLAADRLSVTVAEG